MTEYELSTFIALFCLSEFVDMLSKVAFLCVISFKVDDCVDRTRNKLVILAGAGFIH